MQSDLSFRDFLSSNRILISSKGGLLGHCVYFDIVFQSCIKRYIQIHQTVMSSFGSIKYTRFGIKEMILFFFLCDLDVQYSCVNSGGL